MVIKRIWIAARILLEFWLANLKVLSPCSESIEKVDEFGRASAGPKNLVSSN